MKRTVIGVLVSSLLLSCGGGDRSDGERSPAVDTAAARALAGKRDAPPLSIDPDKEEMIRTGTPAERLLAKYELLLERIRLEREENVFNVSRALEYGLKPIAGEHHELLAEGVIDTVLTMEFVHLAEYVLADYILRSEDPRGVEAEKRLSKVREMIPEHQSVLLPK
ncbi:MAG: hypothetical protein ABIK65_03250 [Candidatus Eisenbacteria bacterium]